METLHIKSGQGDYRVDFPTTLEDLVAEIGEGAGSVMILDHCLADLYGKALAPFTKALPTYLAEATEEEKTLDGVRRCLDFLQRSGATKKTTMIAVGGGIIQDIAAFSAHIYYRGIRWTHVPTTLLAMGDSCIGAKCSLNHNGFKNQLGVFHAPSRVLICPKFLETLSEADIRSGYGEILKLLLTGSRAQYQALVQAVDAYGFRNPDLAGLIRQSLAVKKAVIEADEYEADLRRILNFGHTFGHSLEAMSEYEVPHGLAVAWGVDLANYIARDRGLLSEEDYRSVHDFIARHFSSRMNRRISAAQLIQGMRRDKKVKEGKLVLILMERPGSLKIVPVDFDEQLESQIRAYLETSTVVHWD